MTDIGIGTDFFSTLHYCSVSVSGSRAECCWDISCRSCESFFGRYLGSVLWSELHGESMIRMRRVIVLSVEQEDILCGKGVQCLEDGEAHLKITWYAVVND